MDLDPAISLAALTPTISLTSCAEKLRRLSTQPSQSAFSRAPAFVTESWQIAEVGE